MPTAASTRPPYADASPAQIRAALVPQEATQFDEQYAAALDDARRSYSLGELEDVLASWRRVAAMTTAHGSEAHRRMLAQAEQTLDTGKAPAGSVPWRQVQAKLGL